MCGICGVIEWDGLSGDAAVRERELIRENKVANMLDCLIHRGPDGLGADSLGGATLGAVRLAIRGLEDGRQPIVDEENGILAVCNGEIDNHLELKHWLALRGRHVAAATDVAVLPGLYLELGAAFVERLVGAFAIGLWSAREGALLLVRDRAGERPLHVIVSERGAQFASELAALAAGAATPLAADTEALRGYLSAGFFPAPHDPFRGVRRVAPGELLEISKDGIRSRRYWSWQPGASAAGASASANAGFAARPTLDEFDTVLRRAVGRQSEVDVPYGVFLSGGLDSSLVAAVLRRLRPEHRLAAFALKFAEASYDESEYARRVAVALGVELHCVEVGADALPQTITELVASSGEPLADPAWVPTALLARRAAQDVKIALVGEGADELFGGYPTYIGAGVYEGYARFPAWVRRAVRWGIERWPVADKKVTLSFLLKRFVQGEGLDAVARHLLWTSTVSPQLMARLGVPVTEMRRAEFADAGDLAGGEPAGEPASGGARVLDRLQRLDLENSLAEGLLTKADRASMRYAIELRAPYLDVEVMEFAARLPARERVRGFETKVFLKRFAERYLPKSTVYRRKRGLSVPLARWLRDPLYDWARARLGAEWLEVAGVRPGAALELLEEHRQRGADFSRALWTLIVLSEWIEWAARRGSDSHEAHTPVADARADVRHNLRMDAKTGSL